MASDYTDDVMGEPGSTPLDIDNVLMLLQVEQEQIQKRTFTNWVNAQLAKRRPPCSVVDLFNDFRDGSKLLDLLEVMSDQRIIRERGRGTFQHRSNIEKGLSLLRSKSIKLVNINIPDIIDGKPCIILGLVWTIILQYHIEELASGLCFTSHQSSMESLASLDSGSWRSVGSAGGATGSMLRQGSPLHARFRLSAKKTLMLWVREQCHKAGCSANVKDFKGSWRSGVLFLAILSALRHHLVDLSEVAGRSNRENLDEAFRVAEQELGIPRLLEPVDVDVQEPDEKSIMTYVTQFLRYSKDVSEEDSLQDPQPPKATSPVSLPVHYTPAISASPLRQVNPERKVQEVSCWLLLAHEELLEGWDSTRGENYCERYNVFHTFVTSFNEQRPSIMSLLSAVRRSSAPSEEQRGLKEAWDALTQKLHEYKLELDGSLPAPLDVAARWLRSAEDLLAEEDGELRDHRRAADQAKEKREQLKVCLQEISQQMSTFQAFQKQQEYGTMLVPIEKIEDLKRRFTGVRVSAKYHNIQLKYRQHRHTVLDLLSQIGSRVHLWARPYLSPEALRLLLHDWHELVTNQELPSSLEAALQQLKGVSEIYSTKSALSADYRHIYQQETLLEEDTAAALAQVSSAKNTLARVLSAWDSYSDEFSSMQAWLEQDSDARGCGSRSTATAESVAEWATRHAHLNDVASFLMESTDPRTSSSLEEELVKLNAQWADFVHRNTIENLGPIVMDCSSDIQSRTPHVQALLKETTLLLQKPVQTMSDPLRTYWKRIQLLLRRLKDVDLEALVSSPESSVGQLEEVKMAVAEASETLCEADRLCAVLQCSISSLDTRLAELLHWETEAQEMHQLLGTTEQQQQQQQYPRVQVLISRGLQLEGQVVTEEQALQASIRANQKSPPIPYLQTTVMQDRVQAALAQSQEVVRMLSNLGARRDTSTSPTEGRSAKVFIRDENTAPQGRRPDTAPPQTSPVELHPCHETFLSNVVVQHCGEGRKSVSSHSSAQQIPTAEAPTPSWTGMSEQQQTMELNSGTTQQKPKCHRPHVQVRAKGEPKVGKMHQDAEHQPTDTKECKAGQYVFTHVDVEPKLPHKAETHEPISSLRPQCKKAQAVKNRPWLRNRSQVRLEPALQGRVFAQGPTWAQDRPVSPMQDMILPSHIQVGCHLQSWAPVGPDTPMPLACSQAEPEPLVGAQASSEPRPEPENQAQEILPHQYQSQMPQSSPAHTQAQAQTPPQKSVAPSQAKAEPIATVHVAPGQTHARTQVGSWSAMSAQPGALVELQARPPTFIQEPQCQDAIQHRHHTPQPVVEAPQAPQLAPSARPQRPYMRHSGYSTMPQPSPLQQMQLHSHALVQAGSLCQARPQIQHSPMRAAVLTLPQCVPEQFATQLLWRYKAEFQLTAQPRIATLTQGSALAASKPLPQPLSPLMTVEHPLGPATQFQTQTQTATIPDPQSPAQAMLQVKLAPQAQDPSQDKQKDSVAVLESHMCVRSREESPHLLAPRQAYTKARALAQSNFEKSKHCLQEHILEAVSHQAAVTNTLRTLDPELLEGFLRAAKSMEAFCTPWQLRDMQLLTQSFSAQWEAYFSSEGDGARACQRVEALRELCHVLSPQDAHRLAHTQQSECESSLAVIQRQFGSDQQAPQSDERVAVFKVEQTPSVKSMPLGTPQIPSEVSQNKPKAVTSEQKVPGQSSVDEDGNQKEALEKYEISMNSLQVQLWKNEQVMGDVPSDSVTLKDLHSRLQELQFLRQDTESLWLEFTKQCSQLPGREQEKCYLQNQWRAQQAQLQGRGGSLGAALRQIDSTENHMVDFTERLERYLRQAKDIKAFTLTDANILKDIKELDKNIQSELDQLVHLNPEYSNLDPRDCLPLSREVEAHRCSLYQLAQQVRKSEAAARALDLFLVSLRTVKEDIDRPCADASCAKLALDSLKDKAPQLNLLLQGARLMFTRDGSPASCLDMVSVLLNKLEEADSGALKRDACSQFLGLRKRTLLEELRKIRATVEARGLTEATVPAVQHRLRALSDVEGQLQAHNSEIQGLKELPECQSQNLLEELEAEYNSTLMSLANSKHQCGVLTQLLKTFQSCRSHMSGIVLRAEQTVGEQASYMGKDNLRRTIAKVVDIKEDLSGLGERMDELRTVCRQLQSQLKKFPECREAAFEAEADRLMDIWLDVIEKVDAYMDNLQVGSELWDKELALGAEIDNWIASKLALFAESHPFHNQQQVLALKEEIQVYEKNIQHFHNNCEEIQKLLQSHESPLELQVMETQLRKRLEQVKELFADCTDVFEELMVVKNHLGQKLQACLSAVENIKGSVSKLQASQPDAEAHLQDLHDGLEAQEEQAELVLREMALVSGVAGTQVLEELWAGCGQLMDVIARTKDAIRLKREEKGKGPFEVIQDERQSFEGWFQDLRLAIQVSFEEPESSADVETALQKLTGFLKANHAEDRLEQLKEHMEGGHLQIHPQQLRELKDWLNEQYKDVDTFKARCLSRQKQMESLSRDMNRLQTQCDAFHEWLRGQEELSTAPSAAQRLHLQESQAADVLVELLDSVRRHGVTADPILKDVDDAISRYRKLEARLWAQAEEEKQVMDGGLGHFTTQAQYLGSWFKELLCSFTLVCSHLPYQERSLKAQAVLSAKEEGDTRMKSLQLQCQSLCEQDPHSKQRVQQALRDLEDEWRSILRAAQDVVEEVEMRDKPAQREHLEAAMQSEAQHLKEQAQSLHNSPDSDQAAQEAIRGRTEAAEASAQIKNTALPAHIEATRLWIEERRQQLLPLGPLVPLQERLRVTQSRVKTEPAATKLFHKHGLLSQPFVASAAGLEWQRAFAIRRVPAEDERQRLLAVLGEAFEQRQFLSDCLDRDVFEQLSQDISEVLRGAGTLKMSQCQEEPNAKGEATSNCNLSAIAALDAQPKEAKMSLVAPPPRKNKQSAATKSPVEQNTFPTNEPVAHFVTDIIESAISNKAAIELESRKTSAGSHFGTGFSQVVHMKEGRISPPAKKSKSVELSTQVPVKETTQELNLHDREHPVCEEATEVSASGQACGMTEVVTATRHANIVSEQNHPEEAAAGIAQFATVYQRNLSPPARRSTNIMLTPMLPTAAREGLVYAAETSQEHKVCEEAPKESTSQEATVGTGLIESAMSQLPQEVEGTSSASVVPSSELVEAEGEISPPKRKLKAAEPHFHETAEQKLLDGSEQTKGVVAPRPPKRKPKRSTVPPPIPKEGHPERLGCADVAYAEELAKREMIPQEPPKSPKHKAASLYVEPDLAATNVAGPEPAASVLVDGKLSESFKVAPRPIETSPVAVEQGASENDEGKNLAKPAQALCITKVRSPVQAVIELELLEVAREPAGQANAKDVAVENDNAKRCLSRDGAPVDALQLNIQMDKDFSAETALQGESPMVLAGQLVETVLCDEAVEKTCKAEINLQRPTDDEEHDGASLPVGALQDTPVTIHMGPHVRLVQVEIKPCQEQNKDKLETEAVEEPEKATVDEMSPGGKPNTSAERNAGKVVSVAQKDKAKCNQKEKPPQLIQTEEIGTVPLAASLGDAHMAVTQDSKMKELSQGESLMTMPREESSESLAEAPCQPDPEAKEVSQGETSMTMAREESPELAEAPCQLDPMANEVSQGEFFMTMPQEESPESLAESPCQPDPKALAAAQTEARQMDAPTEQSQNASRCEVYATGTLQMRQASVKRSESDTDIAERASLTDIFSELKATAEMEILHADSCDDCLAELMSSTNSDLNVLLCGLVSNLVSCKNRSAELQVAAMSRQLKEAKKCHDTSREQAALLEAEGDSLEKRWSAAARDAAAVVMDKVQRLQLVQNFFQQNDKVKTTLEHLAAQLNMSRLAAAESHHQEAECLNSTKRAFKENRSVLRELLGIHARLHPLLGHAHRAAAKNVIETRQEDWRALERATEKALHWSDVQARSCSDLLLELSYLRGHLELLSRQLEGSPWDCAKVTQLMIAHAEVKAAHVKYYHLKERSEALPSNVWPKERHEIKKALDNVKDQLCLTEEWMASKIQMSGDAVTRKVLTLGRDGLSWAKQMESSIEGMCTRVPLLPEEVHHQLGALKKLQSQVMAKHRQLELQVKAEIELLPQLDGVEEMPAVGSMLKCLQEHSKSLIQKLTDATAHLESGLRIREAVAERIADLDYWVGAHLQRETLETVRTDFATADGESQEVPIQVEKQCATCEALFMQTKDIASELSVAESCQLFDKLTQLQEEISNIGSCWRAERKEFEEHARSVDSSERELVTVEHSLRRMQDQLHQLKFPTLTESLEVLEYFQHQLLEHRSTIGLLWAWTQEVKTNEFDSVVAEIQNQLTALRLKASEQHKYLYMRQNAEALKEAMEEQVCQTKEDTRAKERYKTYHKLLCNFPLIKGRCKEVVSKLQMISTDFDPAQLRSEQRRLQQNEESLQNVKTKIFEGLGGIKCALLQELDLDSGRKAMRAFLEDAHRELQKPMLMAPDEAGIHRQFQKVVFLKNTLEWRMRALELLEEGSARSDLRELTNCVLRQCDSQMDNISDARTSLRNYTQTVKRALQFLRDVEISLLLLPGVCGEKLEETKEILDSLEDHFQTHMDQLSQVALDPSLSPLGVERLQESTLSQLLVRMSTLKAKGYIQLENLSSCAENNRKYAKSLEGISLHARNAEASLEYFVSREAHSLDECTERLRELQVLRADLDCALRQLEDMEEWCPEQRCQAQWETSAAVAWTRVIKLRFGSRRLSVRLEQRIVEWSNIARSVEKASAALRQTEEELPELAPLMGSTKELVDLQQCWEKYRDRLDCEHGALCALEQRVARLLGVHDGTEEEPPTPLCQHLQAIRAAYGRVKRSSRDGLEQIKLELEDNEKLQEELQVVWMWLTTTDSLLSQMDPSNGIVELKVLHGQLCVQKALVRGIRERLKSKYLESDVVPLEIHGRLQEVQKALEQVQAKVEEAMETSGPTHRIEAELLETQVGLRSVQERLQDRSCNMADAKRAQKLVWDELKKWHSQVAALEANVRDHAPSLTQRLAAVQQLCVQLTERAEQKTALIGKTQGWLEEHREMITSSKSWMLESQAWLATPRTYTTSKCLSEHVTALQMVLKDAAQIRNALESFSSVLEQMSQVVDVSAHLEQRAEADRQLAAVQNSFAESLSQMERAAAEVTAMETEAIKMETDVAEIKTLLCSPETLFSPKKKHLKMLERRIRSMRSSITDIQKAKLLLRLPEKTDKTLTVLRLINQLQTSLPDLEKKIQALSIQQRPAQRARGESLQAMSLMELELPRSLEEREKGEESEESEESKVSQVREVDDPEPNETKEAAPGQRHAGVAHIVTPHEDSMPERSEVSMPERSQASPEQSQEASGTTEQNCFEDLSSSLESVTHPKDPEAMVNTSTGSKSPAASQQRCSLC
ncbi:nesprin-2 isoform X10 [Syngnathus typhle]|uniref:nesprin-2 isoform X10 n=1 Tax=Syngnathus typhle TaxID=161592 RepID=UPI002A6988A0|nr:nesprin-2 isoform X10 [Syngnathus typhle]